MTRRSGRSTVVQELLDGAQASLWNSWKEATSAQHRGVRGGLREASVREFLAARLPTSYSVASGEVIDSRDRYSRQADLLVYEADRNAPFRSGDSILLPAEAALAVVEVKSRLTATEMGAAVNVARSIRELSPFGRRFVGTRTDGAPAKDNRPRCFFTLFAYETDLSAVGWAASEWSRYKGQLAPADPRNLIDRIVVLNRGMLNPPSGSVKTAESDSRVLHEWFVNLVNFLGRESDRRPPMDWQSYFGRYSKGWTALEGRESRPPRETTASEEPRSQGKRGQRRQPRVGNVTGIARRGGRGAQERKDRR